MPIRVQLSEYGRDDMAHEGVYSIATRDLGAQYYMIKRQPKTATFVPGKLLVSKVEIMRTYHEEKLFQRQNWNIWRSPTIDKMLAHKAFAFASNRGIYVWKRFRDPNYPLGGATSIADTPALISITEKETHEDYSLWPNQRRARYRSQRQLRNLPATTRTTDISLWQAYAKILWEFICRSPEGQKRIDEEGRIIVTRLSPEIPGGAIRSLETGVL